MLQKLQELKLRVELFTDIAMYMMNEKDFRGGICIVNKRYSKAIKDMLHILYIDANNLYGWAMCQCLPSGDYKWLTKNQLDALNSDRKIEIINSWGKDASTGYILEIDAYIPDEFHDKLSDLPICPENRFFDDGPFMDNLAKQCNITQSKDCKKLTPNLCSKERYVVHYRNLQLYIELGLVVTNIHRVISFTQSKWLKEYIDFNTANRKAARNAVDKDIFKLLSNSCYGRLLMNVRNHMDIKLLRGGVKIDKDGKPTLRSQRIFNDPLYHDFRIFNDQLAAVHMNKSEVFLKQPVSAGFSVLELSKLLMYETYYKKLKPMWGDNVKLMYMDTDSFILEIKSETYHKDLLQMREIFDFSNYPLTHEMFEGMSEEDYENTILSNKAVLGKFKDESEGEQILEFVALKPKMYSILCEKKNLNKMKAKRCKKSAIKLMRHQHYIDCLHAATLINNDVHENNPKKKAV